MSDLTRTDVESLPKVELHVHLEGSIHASTAIRLAERHGQDPTRALVLQDGAYPRRFDDFMHFVDTFLATSKQLREPEDLATVAADFAQHQLDQNVRYTEATFTALTHVRNGMPEDEVWAAVRDGLARVPGTTVRLIVDAVRDMGVGHAEQTVALAEAADAPIAGFGLSGIEGSEPEGSFQVLREAADRLGLGLAVHAGETGTPDNVRAAIDDLGADRIGHGIAVVRDEALVARLAAEGTIFEVCPSSNVSLGVIDDLDAHPLPRMVDAGLAVTVNSDDPPFFSTTLTDELWWAAQRLGLDRSGLAELQRRAARASFADEATKAALVTDIDAWERG